MPWRPPGRQQIGARHLATAAVLLGGVGLLSLLWFQRSPSAPDDKPVARVTDLSGHVARSADSGAAPVLAPLASGDNIRAGDRLRTRPGARLTLRRESGLTLRLGPDSLATWDSAGALRLSRGAVYIETADSGKRDALVVVTHGGRVHHLGTRFGVEVDERHVRVTVRDGAVRIAMARGTQDLPAGRQGRIDAEGVFQALALPAESGPWNWMLDQPPHFAIEDRPLREVVQELAANAGFSLTWSAQDLVRDADGLILHGPPLEMTARRALDAVLLTTRFTLRQAGQDGEGTPRMEVVER